MTKSKTTVAQALASVTNAAKVDPVQVCYDTVYPLLVAADHSQAENATRAKTGVAAIVALWTAHGANLETYISEVFALFGNDNKNPKKPDAERGRLNIAMGAANVAKTGAARTLFSMLRTVAIAMPKSEVRDLATKGEAGINKLATTARKALGRVSKSKTKTAPVGEVVSREPVQVNATLIPDNVGMDWVRAHVDLAYAALRDAAIKAADSITLARLGDIEIHLASKTSKTA